jgi:putative transposase
VDQDGNGLDILVQGRRNQKAAQRVFRKLLTGLQDVPRVSITDQLKRYGAAKREILPGVELCWHKGVNNRAENSHQPRRLREKKRRRFTSAQQAQRFLAAFGPIAGHFQPRRHLWHAGEYRTLVQARFPPWNEVTEVKKVAERSSFPGLSPSCGIFLLCNSAIHCVPTGKLTIPGQPESHGDYHHTHAGV